MRTVTFKSVWEGAWRRAGLDPDTADLSAGQKERMALHIERRLRDAIEKDWWPELTLIETRAVVTGLVDPDEASKTPIGEVQSVTTQDPRTTVNVFELSFWLDGDGIQLGADAPASVYVSFRARPPRLTMVAYAVGTTYAAHDLVYYATTGEVYICIKTGTGKTPSSEPTYWTKQDIPWIFKEWLQLAGAADEMFFLQGREKAQEYQEEAYMELERVHTVQFGQQRQVGSARVKVVG